MLNSNSIIINDDTRVFDITETTSLDKQIECESSVSIWKSKLSYTTKIVEGNLEENMDDLLYSILKGFNYTKRFNRCW